MIFQLNERQIEENRPTIKSPCFTYFRTGLKSVMFRVPFPCSFFFFLYSVSHGKISRSIKLQTPPVVIYGEALQ